MQSQPTRAEQQLRAARHDPRLDRPRGAIAGDFTDYIEEAERVRMLHLWAVANMRGEVERVRERLDADEHRDPAQDAAVLRAAAERAQLAEAETTNGHPYINASTLIGLHGALDALVEDLAPSFARTAPDLFSHTVIEGALRQAGVAEDLLTKDTDALRTTLRKLLEPTLPRSWRPTRTGAERWEKVLRPAGLATSPQRPIPADLDLALREITNLRDVLVHRSGRLDDKAATDCPTLVQELGFRVGHMVRLDREHYRRYSAALRAYGTDVVQRLTVPAGMDTFDDLQRWRGAHALNA